MNLHMLVLLFILSNLLVFKPSYTFIYDSLGLSTSDQVYSTLWEIERRRYSSVCI